MRIMKCGSHDTLDSLVEHVETSNASRTSFEPRGVCKLIIVVNGVLFSFLKEAALRRGAKKRTCFKSTTKFTHSVKEVYHSIDLKMVSNFDFVILLEIKPFFTF